MKTKLIYLYLCIISYPILLFGQGSNENFYVLHVKGNIILSKDSSLIKTGDILKPDDTFTYSTDKDIAVLISDTRGRLVLYKNKPEKINGKFKYFLNENILPSTEYAGTRSGKSRNSINLVINQEKELIIPKQVRVSYIPKDSNSYYFISFNYSGNDYQEKLSIVNNDYVQINSNLLTSKNKDINVNNVSDFNLNFYNAEQNKAFKVQGINFFILSITQLKLEIDTYKMVIGNSKNSKNEENILIREYLEEVYGKLDDEIIDKLI